MTNPKIPDDVLNELDEEEGTLYGVLPVGAPLHRAQWTLNPELAADIYRCASQPMEIWKATRKLPGDPE